MGIEAPARPYGDREGQPFQEEAKRLLEDMALGREVRLYYAGLTRDRYDRALAQVRTDDALGPDYWLNAEMVRKGGARVRVYPDTARANALLLDMERGARENTLGLWRLSDYKVPHAGDLPGTFEGFQLVRGRTSEMQGSEAYGAVCELLLEGSPLRLKIMTASASLCQLPQGTDIRARGYVRDMRMEISHPINLEEIPPAAL